MDIDRRSHRYGFPKASARVSGEIDRAWANPPMKRMVRGRIAKSEKSARPKVMAL